MLRQNSTKRPFLLFSVCWSMLYSEGFLSTPLLVSTAGFMEAECVHMDPVERRGSQGSPQVTGRHCRRMWLCSLTRVCWCGPTHPICQCNYSSSLAGVSYMQQWSYEGEAVLVVSWGKKTVWWPTRSQAATPSSFVFILVGVGSVIWVSIQSAGL